MGRKLGFGLMRLPMVEGAPEETVDIEAVKEMVDAYLAAGFTYFDTAWMYCGGKSENAVKECIVDRHPRESFTITTKLPSYMIHKPEDREWLFNTQLEKTGAGYFDYYWLHDVNANSIQTFDKFDCWNFIREKKEAGLVKHIGFSYHDGPELLDKILNDHPEVEYVQLQINYLDWDSMGVRSRECYEVATAHGKPVIVMEPVKGGTLANVPDQVETLLKSMDPEMSVASWAIRFVANLDNVMMVLSGMSNMEQLNDNMSYMSEFKPLTDEQVKNIHMAADIINGNIAIPCTGCSYCTVNCPMNIPIPKYFSLYNNEKLEDASKDWTPQGGYYNNLCVDNSKASECIKCGQCESMCPQHLPIRDYLEDVAAQFE